MKISWINPEDLLRYELLQQKEEGKDVASSHARWEKIQREAKDESDLQHQALQLVDALIASSPSDELTRNEPSELDAIHAQRPNAPPALQQHSLTKEELYDRILGGWLGRAAGCLLGKPVEKYSRAVIKEILQSNGTWPLSDYITAAGMPEEILQKYPWNRHSGKESLKENIACMTEDDDMNYAMLNLHVLEKFGQDFSTENIAETWLSLMPGLATFTAERVAYLNLLVGHRPPQTATHRNPYREWIGAQIRADVWGWTAPGNPQLAAARAWRDARLSHVRNGIYGEMFFAAALASAFHTDSLTQIIAQGLAQIPQHSRLAHAIAFVLSLHEQEPQWERAVDRLYEKFEEYHWVHVLNNAALVVAALLYGEGDYEKTICNIVMAGWDTDSNGATAGAILGTMHGAHKLPSKWIAPLQNKIRSSMMGFDHSTFEDLARRTLQQAANHEFEHKLVECQTLV